MNFFIFIVYLNSFFYSICQSILNKTFPFTSTTNSQEFMIRRSSSNSVFTSNMEFNLLFNLDDNQLDLLNFRTDTLKGSFVPYIMYDDNKEASYILIKEESYSSIIDINSNSTIPLWLTTNSDIYAFSQYNSTLFFNLQCDQSIDSIILRLINVETQNIIVERTNSTTLCLEKINFIAKFSNNKIITLFAYLQDDGRINSYLWNITQNDILFINNTDLMSFHSYPVESLQFVEIFSGNGMLCSYISGKISCFILTSSNTYSAPFVDILTGCVDTHKNYYVLEQLGDHYGIVGCQASSYYQIQIVVYDFQTISQATPIMLNTPITFTEGFLQYQFTVLSDFKVVIAGIDSSYSYYWNTFSVAMPNTNVPEDSNYFSFYADSSDLSFHQCYTTCLTCSGALNGTEQNCLSCLPGEYFYEDRPTNCALLGEQEDGYIINPVNNKYTYCTTTFYIDNNTFVCGECNDNYPYLIQAQNQCVKNCNEYGLYLYIDQCYEQCPENTIIFNNSSCVHFQDNNSEPIIIETSKEEMKENIKENIVNLAETSSIVVGTDFVLQAFTTDTPTITISWLTTVTLGPCEAILRASYTIPANESLYISKIDSNDTDSPTPTVIYQVFDIRANELDLSVCDNQGGIEVSYPIVNATNVNITLGQQMKEEGFDVFNREDQFFNDICVPYSVDNADVSLKDRVNDFYQNVSFCDDGCVYEGVDYDTNRVKCKCLSSLTEQSIEKSQSVLQELYANTNLPLFTCYKEVFTSKVYMNNIGFYFHSSILFIELLLIVVFFCSKGFNLIYFKGYSKFQSVSNPEMARKTTIVETIEMNVSSSPSHPIIEKDRPKMNTLTLEKEDRYVLNNNTNLDSCIYNKAHKEENRSFFKFFFILLVSKIDLISIFFCQGDFDILELALSEYLFSLNVDFFINGLLFSDDIISQRYNNGKVSLVTTLLLTLISNIVSFCITYVIRKLICYTRPLELLLMESHSEMKYLNHLRKLIRIIKIKIRIFFILTILISTMIVYYISTFCIIYKQSQWNWFTNSIISLGLSIITSFGMSFLISFIRYLGLWMKSEKIYNVSLYLNRS